MGCKKCVYVCSESLSDENTLIIIAFSFVYQYLLNGIISEIKLVRHMSPVTHFISKVVLVNVTSQMLIIFNQ